MFHPQQIVCLEQKNADLYAEVIQEIYDRQKCWVRPLFLKYHQNSDVPTVEDLHLASDLVWPTHAFRLALDTEMIPLLGHVQRLPDTPENVQYTRQQLNQFIRRVWQEQTEVNGVNEGT